MKKSLIALTAVVNMATAMAATTATTTTSSTDLNESTLDKIIKNTRVSYYGAYYKDNQADTAGNTTFYNEMTARYNYGSGSVYIRPRFQAVDRDNQGTNVDESSLYIRNPRVGISPWSYTNGNFNTASEIRMDVAIDAAEDFEAVKSSTHYGVVRLGQLANYTIANKVTLTGFAGLYEYIIKDNKKTTDANKDQMDLLLDAAVTYRLNDAHSLTLDYQMQSTIDERATRGSSDFDFYTNKDANNIFYLTYTNSMINSLSLSPSLYLSRNELADSDNLGLQLEVSYTF